MQNVLCVQAKPLNLSSLSLGEYLVICDVCVSVGAVRLGGAVHEVCCPMMSHCHAPL